LCKFSDREQVPVPRLRRVLTLLNSDGALVRNKFKTFRLLIDMVTIALLEIEVVQYIQEVSYITLNLQLSFRDSDDQSIIGRLKSYNKRGTTIILKGNRFTENKFLYYKSSECCLTPIQLYHGENKLIYNEMMMMSALF
jgi:hypothetical protein